MKTHQPHDKFFKETFSDMEVTKDFIENYLPKGLQSLLDLKTLKQESDTFIDHAMRMFYSDLVFTVSSQDQSYYIYFLFEHKSYHDALTVFQMYRYIGAIWEKYLKQNPPSKELPVVIPVLIYHGENAFEGPRELKYLIKSYDSLPMELNKAIPNFEVLLFDLSHLTDEELKGSIRLKLFMKLARDIFRNDPQKIMEDIVSAAQYLKTLSEEAVALRHFETYMRYIFSAKRGISKEEVQKMIKVTEKIYPKASQMMMTYEEMLISEGLEKGIEEGIEKGKLEGQSHMLVSAFNMKFGTLNEHLVHAIYKLSPEKQEELLSKIFVFDKIEDLEAFLA